MVYPRQLTPQKYSKNRNFNLPSHDFSLPDYHADFGLFTWLIGFVVALTLSVLVLLCRRHHHHYVIWKEVTSYANSLLLEHHLLRAPPLPPPLPTEECPGYILNDVDLEAKGVLKCVKLDEIRWPLPAQCLRLEERIAAGSYGDVFKGMLIMPVPKQKRKHPKKVQITSRQIVAKMLNSKFTS